MPTFNGSHKQKVSRELFGYRVEYTDDGREAKWRATVGQAGIVVAELSGTVALSTGVKARTAIEAMLNNLIDEDDHG